MKLSPKQIIETINNLKSERQTWENHWQEVGDFVVPRRGEVTVKFSPGQKRNTRLFDTTAQQACVLLSGALSSLLTNPQVQWFEFLTGDKELDARDDVRLYLQEVSRRMMNMFNNSNFYSQVDEMYGDLCSYGTGCMSINEDPEMVVRFNTHHISEYYIRENNKAFVDEVYRKFKWTAFQILSEFGENAKQAKSVARELKSGSNRKFDVLHAVYPDDRGDGKTDTPFHWVSQWIIEEDQQEVRVGGFNEFPFTAPRWKLGTGEMYGRSPATTALPDIKMINKMEETMIKGAQKTVDPPLQAPDDGYQRPIRTQPGGISYYRAGTGDIIRPVFNDFNPNLGENALERVRERIKQAFFIDQLQLREGPQMTATEVLQRRDQSMTMLAPVLARLQHEFLRPMIDRVFALMSRRRGMLPRAPRSLQGRNVDVRYSSLIARVQSEQEAQNFQRFLGIASPIIGVAPDAMDNIDTDQVVKDLAVIHRLPQEMLRKKDDVEKLREQRAEAQRQAEEEASEAQQAENASKVSKLVPVNQ